MSVLTGIGVGLTAIGLAFVAIKIGVFIQGVWTLTTAFLGLGTGLSLATGGLTLIIPLLAGVATWFLTTGNSAENASGKISKFSRSRADLLEVTKILDGQKTMWELLVLSIKGASKATEEFNQIGMSKEEKAKAFIEKETGIKELSIWDKSASALGNIVDRAKIFYAPVGEKLGLRSEENANFQIIKAGERMQGRLATEAKSMIIPRLIKELAQATENGGEARIVGKGLSQKVVVNINNQNGVTKSVTTEGNVDSTINNNLDVGPIMAGVMY
jgi:hypothetical protein